MHMRVSLWTAACLSIIPSVTAFYPYIPNYGDDDSGDAKLRRAVDAPNQHDLNERRSMTLPLRRVALPNRRDNTYNIVNSKDPGQANSVAIDQDGDDLSYMVAVTIGDSKEEYHLLLDSAASNTWVMGQECKTKACETHNLFGEGDSSTLKTETTPFSITYGTGTVSGTIASDTLHIGALSPSVSFGLATNVSTEFEAYPMDGILGIGRGDNIEGTIEAPQVMDVLTTSNLIGAKVYGIHLSRAKDGLNDGELNFGEPNTDRFDGELNTIPTVANKAGFWEVAVDDVGVDGVGLGIGGKSAIIDTGTSFILMPEVDATSVHDLVPGYKKIGETYTVPCDTQRVVWMEFGGQKYNISTKDWIGGKTSDGSCKSNIIGRQTFGDNQWLVGDVFLKNVYSVFDFGNSQVGFGVKSGEQEAVSSASPSGTATSTGESDLPTPTASGLLPAGATADPTAEAADTPGETPSPTGGAGHLSSSTFVYLVALELFVLLI